MTIENHKIFRDRKERYLVVIALHKDGMPSKARPTKLEKSTLTTFKRDNAIRETWHPRKLSNILSNLLRANELRNPSLSSKHTNKVNRNLYEKK